jgi:TetR/AcrR family transcriptional repressor of nem operon
MGRRKSYQREVVLEEAMRLFWARGFHATSTRELTEAMGVNVYSLYAEFGSKEGLYEAALLRYERTVLGPRLEPLEGARAGLDELRLAVGAFAEAPGPGCLLTNGLAEGAPVGEHGAAWAQGLVRRIEAVLVQARSRGQLRSRAPVARLASSLAVTLLGLSVLRRAGAEAALLEAAADQAMSGIEAYSVQRAAY